jgi:hypothetical protein
MKSGKSTPKKSYAKPKLTTHGDVRKLTQKSFSSPSRSFGSGIFDHGKGRDEGHGHGHGNHGD